jgi:hypothetical protein
MRDRAVILVSSVLSLFFWAGYIIGPLLGVTLALLSSYK